MVRKETARLYKVDFINCSPAMLSGLHEALRNVTANGVWWMKANIYPTFLLGNFTYAHYCCGIAGSVQWVRSAFFWDLTQRRYLPTFPDNLPAPSPRVKQSRPFFSDCLTRENGTGKLFRNVGNYQSALRNISEERISRLHRGGSLKSRTI